MKTLFFSILLCTFIIPFHASAQQKGLAVYDSAYIYDYKDHAWVLDSKRDDFIYEGTNAIEYFQYKLSESGWVNDQHVIQTFDDDDRILSQTYKQFDGQQWKNTTRYAYVYHGDNEPDYLVYQWSGGQWKEYYANLFYYDSNNKLVEWNHRNSFGHPSSINHERKTFEYNEQGVLVNYIYSYWFNEIWNPSSRYVYTYEGGFVKSILVQLGNNVWEDYSISTYHYNTDQLVDSLLVRKINDGVYTDDSLKSYTYDADGNIVARLIQRKQNGQWKNSLLDTYEFSNNYLTYHLHQGWGQSGWIWYSHESYSYDSNYLLTGEAYMNCDGPFGDSTWYYFQVVTGIDNTDPAIINIYPNPTSDVLTIDTADEIQNLEIFTLTGDKLKTLSPSDKKIDLSGLPKGIYILKGTLGGKHLVRKVEKI